MYPYPTEWEGTLDLSTQKKAKPRPTDLEESPPTSRETPKSKMQTSGEFWDTLDTHQTLLRAVISALSETSAQEGEIFHLIGKRQE